MSKNNVNNFAEDKDPDGRDARQSETVQEAGPDGEPLSPASESDIPWRNKPSYLAPEPLSIGVLRRMEDDREVSESPLPPDGLFEASQLLSGIGKSCDPPVDACGAGEGCRDAVMNSFPDQGELNSGNSELILGVKLSQYGPVYFFRSGQVVIHPGGQVLVDTEQGVSLGEVVTARRLRYPLPKLCTEDGQEKEIIPIRGLPGPEDIAAASDNRILASSARLFCKECIRERALDMKLVDVEVLHDRSKIIFYFTAPTRIDFRELVKDLVRNYHTRIELRQIGVRHETQMLGAVGNCGMTCCCRRYLRKFAPVTIKMAKEQNLFLNPAKLSGICGRLLCCLANEQENYEEFHKRSPKIGKKYGTDQGIMKIMRANLFRQSIFAVNELGDEKEMQLEEWEDLHPRRLEGPALGDPPPEKRKRPRHDSRPVPDSGSGGGCDPDDADDAGTEEAVDGAFTTADGSIFGLPGSTHGQRKPRDKQFRRNKNN